jgi:hypothetical protein
MLRIVIINALMFALPFLIYAAYFYFVRSGQNENDMWSEAPVLWLLGAGAALVLVALASLVSFTGSDPGGTYYPSRFEDGVIKPGRIE